MPPPIPVTMPSTIAMTGFSPWASAFDAPVTAKSARPCRVEKRTGVRHPHDQGREVEGDEAGKERHAEITPIGDRAGRNDTDQQVPGDASRVRRRERQHQNAEQIELSLDPRQRPAKREDEGAHQIEHKRKLLHDTAFWQRETQTCLR